MAVPMQAEQRRRGARHGIAHGRGDVVGTHSAVLTDEREHAGLGPHGSRKRHGRSGSAKDAAMHVIIILMGTMVSDFMTLGAAKTRK